MRLAALLVVSFASFAFIGCAGSSEPELTETRDALSTGPAKGELAEEERTAAMTGIARQYSPSAARSFRPYRPVSGTAIAADGVTLGRTNERVTAWEWPALDVRVLEVGDPAELRFYSSTGWFLGRCAAAPDRLEGCSIVP